MDKKKSVLKNIRQAVSVTVILLFLCGFAFPVVLSGISGLIFPDQAKGDLIVVNGQAVGSEHVGQDFTEDYFMKGRPSAVNYNTYTEDEDGNKFYLDGSEFGGLSSGSNNYGPSNPALAERVEGDIEEFLAANPEVKREELPADIVTASGSGLDPHISVTAAELQIPALSKASGISEEKLGEIVENNTDGKLIGIFGEETVNVLKVNIDIAKEMKLI